MWRRRFVQQYQGTRGPGRSLVSDLTFGHWFFVGWSWWWIWGMYWKSWIPLWHDNDFSVGNDTIPVKCIQLITNIYRYTYNPMLARSEASLPNASSNQLCVWNKLSSLFFILANWTSSRSSSIDEGGQCIRRAPRWISNHQSEGFRSWVPIARW